MASAEKPVLVGRIDAQRVIVAEKIDKIYLRNQAYDVGGPATRILACGRTRTRSRPVPGRQRQLDTAKQVLTTAGDERIVLFVTGASGSGKSSFAQAPDCYLCWRSAIAGSAGLLGTPRFARRPSGRGPVPRAGGVGLPEAGVPSSRSVADSVAWFNRCVASDAPPGQVNLIVLDQLEELFTESDPAKREAILAIWPALRRSRSCVPT